MRLNALEYPLRKGESWWVVHPNQSKTEFKVPAGGITVCTEDFFSFTQSTAYNILGDDPHNGWITLQSSYEIIEMPYYVFARYFDAEAFVRGILEDPSQLEKATPFNYKSTLPMKKKPQLDLFDDDHCYPCACDRNKPPKFASGALQQEEILQRAEEQEDRDDWKGVR